MSRFDICLPILLSEEGGFVNDPRDRGGITNLGVTGYTWADWTGKPVTEKIMRELTPAKVGPMYRDRYWNQVKGDSLPAGLDLAMFDFAVNSGPGRAAKYLQITIGAKPDGQIGPATLAALQQKARLLGLSKVILGLMQARGDYLRSLDGLSIYGKGWLKRCDRIQTRSLRMVAA